MSSGAMLCVALAVATIKVVPSLRNSAKNLEKATGSAAEAGPNIVATSENIKELTANLLKASEDVAAATPVLRWIGPAGRAADIANTGLGKLGDFVRGLLPKT